MTFNLIATMRDEGPFVLEWVAHHHVLGFDQIGIASHDCSDGTDLLLDALARKGYIEHFRYEPDAQLGVCHSGYAAMYPHPIIQKAKWLCVLDADEFLNIHVGEGSIHDLLSMQSRDVDILAFNWRIFGGDDQFNWQAGQLVTESYNYAIGRGRRNAGVKCMTKRPRRFRHIHCHNPHGFKFNKPAIYTNMAGEKFEFIYERDAALWRVLREFPKEKIAHEYAQVNHYITRSFPSFLLRRARGQAQTDIIKEDRYILEYYEQYNTPDLVLDDSIHKYLPKTRARIAEMLADPEISRIHNATTEYYNARLQDAQAIALKYADELPASFSKMNKEVKRNQKNFKFALAEA